VCSERIPKPYEHQCCYSQEINYFIRKEIKNFVKRDETVALSSFRKEGREYIGTGHLKQQTKYDR